MPEQDDKITAPEDAVEDLELADEDADKVTGGLKGGPTTQGVDIFIKF